MVARREDAEVSSHNLLLYTLHSPDFCLYYTAAVKRDDFWLALWGSVIDSWIDGPFYCEIFFFLSLCRSS